MTSLIDLTFLLLVTFIMTLPALEQGVSILLPQAKTDQLPTKDNKANTVTIDAENRVYLNNRETTLAELERQLAEMARADNAVLIRADERLGYGSVMDVVKIVYKCRIAKMALVTEEK
jgi:biopolymer transport protein ExbD